MRSLAVRGSIASAADAGNITIEEAFLKCDVVAMVDVSGSMANDHKFRDACEALERIQDRYPGRVAVLQFSATVRFRPDGKLDFEGMGTQMDDVLEFARAADVPGMTFILVSDGYPNDDDAALRVARQYTQPIHTVYIGPEGDEGEKFLRRLSSMTGGKSSHSVEIVQNLLVFTELLLEDKKL